MPRKVIGEGAYGCVHNPSLHCNIQPTANFNYDEHVSKLMKTKNAEEELKEFVTIHQYDPQDEYHLGTPILCKPKQNADELSDIAKCKRTAPKFAQSPDQYSLLVLKYGGPDLKIFCKDTITQFLTTNKEEKSDHFWLEVHHLIKGLKFFKDNGIVHNDLKPQNILYDMQTNKLSFIDFGLMSSKASLTKLSKENKNNLANFHWSFPLDCGFMNYNEYSKYKRNADRRSLIREELADMIIDGDTTNTANLDIQKPEAFEIFFTYINPNGTNPRPSAKYDFMKKFFDGQDQIINTNYDEYISRIIDSIDVYGLGFTLKYILNCFKRHNGVTELFFARCSALFYEMYDPNPETRELNINALLDEYENILLETGLLTRMNNSFENHTLVNRAPGEKISSLSVKSKSKLLSVSKSKSKTKSKSKSKSNLKSKPSLIELDRIADLDPMPTSKIRQINSKSKSKSNSKSKTRKKK